MQNEVIDALPTTGAPDAALLRNLLIKRVIYTFAPDEDPSTFDALDADTGALPQALGFDGAVFWIDPNDTTSDHDGVSVIKTADDYRYKVAGTYDFRSIIDATTATPPTSPSLGDKYIVAAGATGVWSSHADDLAVWTPNGWKFQVPVIGQWVLDESVGGFLAYTSSGWVYGPGARSFDDASIPLSAALGWGAIVPVENQTTTTPPTATKGLRYVVGASATGDWLGKDKQIAICEVPGEWTFYSSENGWQIYDKSTSSAYTWNGTAWLSTAGTWIDRKSVSTVSGSTTAPSGNASYNYSSGTAPTTSARRLIDTATLAFTAKKANAALRLHYSADVTYTTGSADVGTGDLVIAVFRDSGTNAVAWQRIPVVQSLLTTTSQSLSTHLDQWFKLTAPDSSSHTYTIALISRSGFTNQSTDAGSLTLRDFEIEEAA
jgi:hypothetical protein